MSFLLPKDEVTLTDLKAFRTAAVEAGIERALFLRMVTSKEELNVRQFENIFDVAAALDQWNTAALAAVGTAYSVFQAVAAPTLAANKLAVFYGVGIETVPFPVSLLTFRDGPAAGNIRAEFDLERMVNSESQEGFFSEPVVIDPNRQFAVQVTARIATGVLARVQLFCLIVEPAGQRISR